MASGKDVWSFIYLFVLLQKQNDKIAFIVCGSYYYSRPPLQSLYISQQPSGVQKPLV